MAKAPQGINGAFIGRAGNVVGYLLNGQAIVRSLPRPTSNPVTPLALSTRGKMKLLTSFLSGMRAFLKMTFDPEAQNTVYNWYNLAIKYNNPHAIKGTYPDFEVDYAKVVLSRGDLKRPINTRVERTEGGVRFSWDVNKEDKYSQDQAMVMVYFPDDHSAVSVGGNTRRDIGTELLPVDPKRVQKKMETFICFVSNDRKNFSNSLYVGSIEAQSLEETSLEVTIEQTTEAASDKIESSEEGSAHHKILDVARNLSNMGLTDADIATATGLSLDEIRLLN